MIAGSAAFGGSVYATNYDLYVAGTQVTSSNASQIVSGVSFEESTHTLVLNRANISSASDYGIKAGASLSYLNIAVIGWSKSKVVGGTNAAMYLKCQTKIFGYSTLEVSLQSSVSGGDAIYIENGGLTICDGVSVFAYGKGANYGAIAGGYDNSPLVVDHARLKLKAPAGSYGAIYAFTSVSFNGVTLTPSGAQYNTTAQELQVSGSAITDTFKTAINGGYGLWVAGKYITADGTISGDGITGSVSYSNSSSTLTLNNANIEFSAFDAIYAKNALNISLSGTNSIKAPNLNHSAINFGDNGTINGGTISLYGANCIIGNKNVTISNCTMRAQTRDGFYNYGPIEGAEDGDLTIINSNVTALGGGRTPIYWWDDLHLNGCSITYPQGATYSTSSKSIMYNGSEYDSGDSLVISTPQSIVAAKGSEIRVYPNPTTNNLYVNGVDANATIQIYDMTGKLLAQQKATENATINVSGLAKGVYVVSIEGCKIKFVKE